ncbi:hypothetical protein BJP36_38390 [Moorena producens JHB]|uniref:Uncharacterized protein n=1 Tax=Moorena producens (strain JHB) TaxID=1454205 RepID=A0A9Q9UWI8_MOOP1|nr:hypothetical protein [Moorena producens]WAN69950.1 hypothetical protein BJP36_38390 [Moorena producens JHB]
MGETTPVAHGGNPLWPHWLPCSEAASLPNWPAPDVSLHPKPHTPHPVRFLTLFVTPSALAVTIAQL